MTHTLFPTAIGLSAARTTTPAAIAIDAAASTLRLQGRRLRQLLQLRRLLLLTLTQTLTPPLLPTLPPALEESLRITVAAIEERVFEPTREQLHIHQVL